MNRRRFFVQLISLTGVMIGLVFLMRLIPSLAPHTNFSLASIAFFVLLSIFMYFLGIKAAVSKDKNAFTRLIILITFVKMLLTVILVIVYQRVIKPEGIGFVIPFFLVYIVYTAFEVIFLSKLGKIKAR